MTALENEFEEATGRLERITDWMNPILVKEVRQAMRGRFFKISFSLTLVIATTVGLGVCLVTLMENRTETVLGPVFFTAMFACLVTAAQVFVPFSAFLSMSAEWDENTWDLLVLSNLRPKQIVYGKVLSSSVQALLFYSAFGPFLVFAFLLRGVDLTVLSLALGASFILSTFLSCLAVAMSTFGRGRFTRVILMVILTVILIGVSVGTVVAAAGLMFQPGILHNPDILEMFIAGLTVASTVAAFFFAAACARLAHHEENRSTGLRLMSLLVVGSGLAWVAWMMSRKGIDDRGMVVFTCMAIANLFVASIFFSTEEERLGRRVALDLPKNPVLAWLALPLLPGGVRGLVFFVCSSLLAIAWMLLVTQIVDPTLTFGGARAWIPLMGLAFGFVYLGLCGAINASRSGSPGIRIATRVGVLILIIVSLLGPALAGFFMRIEAWSEFDHPANMFMIGDYMWSHALRLDWRYLPLCGAVVVTLLLNVRRMVLMLGEHRRAIKARVLRG